MSKIQRHGLWILPSVLLLIWGVVMVGPFSQDDSSSSGIAPPLELDPTSAQLEPTPANRAMTSGEQLTASQGASPRHGGGIKSVHTSLKRTVPTPTSTTTSLIQPNNAHSPIPAPDRLCDQLAASPDAPGIYGKGLRFDQLKYPARAVIACQEAVQHASHESRFSFQLGRAYYRLNNYAQAVVAYDRAARQDHPLAQHNLAIMMLNGQGVRANPQQALHWFAKAAQGGYAEARFTLGSFYAHGQHGVTKSGSKAFHWYQLAAKQGHAQAQFGLGRLYYYGNGVTMDRKKGAKWIGKAAQQGVARAQYSYGLLFESGTGVQKNPQEARKWFSKAWQEGGLAIARQKLNP
ncbi:MAG: SEL1-like repeat protein [Magnetococcales bacterium]|nr:SEL1-like repeat protein [Magnetococcales bacterium]